MTKEFNEPSAPTETSIGVFRALRGFLFRPHRRVEPLEDGEAQEANVCSQSSGSKHGFM
jgi:hypothetical protein